MGTLGAVGFLEMCGEASVFLEADGQQHYVRGGKPGYYPTFKDKFPHPVPFNLFDPFGLTSKMTPRRRRSRSSPRSTTAALPCSACSASSPPPRASSSRASTRSALLRTRASRWRPSPPATPRSRTSPTCSSSPSKQTVSPTALEEDTPSTLSWWSVRILS